MTNIFDTLQQVYHKRVNESIKNYLIRFAKPEEPLTQAMEYGVLLGGKRLRPFLVYSVGTLFGLSLPQLDAAASAIECIHAYSLIHDDLPAMDNDILRRGQATCHIKYGESLAILAGDALQSLAFEILTDAALTMSSEQKLAMVKALANASGAQGMCQGQADDLHYAGQHINLEQLEKTHQYKTGALIRCAVQLGCLSHSTQQTQITALLEQYAHYIGLAFQIQDDILDVIGTTQALGKSTGNDSKMAKSTYPVLLGLSQSQQRAQQLHDASLAILEQLTAKGYDTAALQALSLFIIQRNN